MTIRCTSCLGQKKVLKLGMTMGECTHCKGTGRLEREKEPETTALEIPIKPSEIAQKESAPTHSKEANIHGKQKKHH